MCARVVWGYVDPPLIVPAIVTPHINYSALILCFCWTWPGNIARFLGFLGVGIHRPCQGQQKAQNLINSLASADSSLEFHVAKQFIISREGWDVFNISTDMINFNLVDAKYDCTDCDEILLHLIILLSPLICSPRSRTKPIGLSSKALSRAGSNCSFIISPFPDGGGHCFEPTARSSSSSSWGFETHWSLSNSFWWSIYRLLGQDHLFFRIE